MILFTLDIKKLREQGKIYIIVTLTCILFSIIYESFSHGVISNFMIFSFVVPLVFGVGINYMFYFFKIKKLPSRIQNKIYNAGIATLTIGSIMEGVLQIYGTTNSKIYVYLVVGIILLFTSIISYTFFKNEKRDTSQNHPQNHRRILT